MISTISHRFNGAPMPAGWTPPPVTVAGKSKKPADMVSWMTKAPIASERAMRAFEPIARDCVQFLPFHELRGKKFFVMNVVRVERDLLDPQESAIQYTKTDPPQPMSLQSAAFSIRTHRNLPSIFKVALSHGPAFSQVFVSRSFADVAIADRLTGFELADPAEDSLDYELSGKSQNVVGGIVG